MRFLIPAVLALSCAPAALAAQEVVQPLPGTTDADRLAEQMRAVAANPRDVTALLTAADLSLSLGDLSGAASLYARAEKVAPNDPRIKAGEGAILVRSERPGEALRYFAQAEAAGYDIRPVAADRGLAYDLVGQQERAQRDYRMALKTKPDDETIRRYALSLGISGKREAALEQLDPLLRKNDRSAWRIRAFVLAMGGDQAGAEKIATTMLPAGMAQGLQPFFRRLPTLGAVDRAFAVHFGEVRATPERLADARLAPVLQQLAPEAAPVALAAVQPAQSERRRGRTRRGREEAAPAVAVAANTARAPAAATPSYQAATAALARVQPVPTEARTPAVTFASAAPVVQPLPAAREPVAATVVPTASPRAAVTAATVQPPPATSATVVAAAPVPEPTRAASAATAPPVPSPGFATAAVEPVPPAAAVATANASSFTAPPSRSEADSVLARIVAGLTIPASELGVVEPARPVPVVATPAPDTAARVIAEAKAKEERDAAAEKALAAKAAADKRAADRKAAADKKALAAKKLADAEKLAAAKAAAEEKKVARANPERIWVQVAGGAYEGGLPKAYAIMKGKAPEVFGSRPGWTTPLRATNRVLTGPFKTDAEARAFVNQLAKAGVPAFTFTSEAGQVVTKLPTK